MAAKHQFWKILDKPRFLIAAMKELAGAAHVSFEGDLRATKLSKLSNASDAESLVLKRNTLSPKQDFIVVPLETDLIGAISSAIGGTIPKSILHIQIEKNGRLELGLYDNFQPKAIFFGPALSPSFLEHLQAEGVVREWIDR
jgi:hypothetical protein